MRCAHTTSDDDDDGSDDVNPSTKARHGQRWWQRRSFELSRPFSPSPPLIPFDLRRGVCTAQVNASAVYARRPRNLGGDKTYTTLNLNAITVISIIKCVLRARVYRLKSRLTNNRKILKRPFPSVNDALRQEIGNVPLFGCIETRKIRINYITHYPYYSFISVYGNGRNSLNVKKMLRIT